MIGAENRHLERTEDQKEGSRAFTENVSAGRGASRYRKIVGI
jgi:hypothetical protein